MDEYDDMGGGVGRRDINREEVSQVGFFKSALVPTGKVRGAYET